MNLLIVDDEPLAVEHVANSLDWLKYRIVNIFSAYSMKQAQKIIENEHVDIMITDIEMPKGSGLDLVNWIREENKNIVCIFLTSHTNFEYAHKALLLNGMSYLLKPVSKKNLTTTMEDAISLLNRQKTFADAVDSAEKWNINKNIVLNRFWIDVIDGVLTAEKHTIEQKAKKRHISLKNVQYLPILIVTDPNENNKIIWEQDMYDYACCNVISEIIYTEEDDIPVLANGKGEYIVLKQYKPDYIYNLDEMKYACRKIIRFFEQNNLGRTFCLIGTKAYIQQLNHVINKLKKMREKHVIRKSEVLVAGVEEIIDIPYIVPDIKKWKNLLDTNNGNSLIKNVNNYLEKLISKNELDGSVLSNFHHDFLQLIYTWLNENNIQAHLLFNDEKSIQLCDHAQKTVYNMKKWIEYVVMKAVNQMQLILDDNCVVEKVKKYINEHYNEEISRSQIANIVFLNPEYLSRIFKKKTGSSISSYIFLQRINAAEKMLVLTEKSIGDIAFEVGYISPSYFSKIFHEKKGVTPANYRRNHRIKI